jgi:hypothetical protein
MSNGFRIWNHQNEVLFDSVGAAGATNVVASFVVTAGSTGSEDLTNRDFSISAASVGVRRNPMDKPTEFYFVGKVLHWQPYPTRQVGNSTTDFSGMASGQTQVVVYA